MADSVLPVLKVLCVFRPQRDHGCWRIHEAAVRSYPHRHVDLQLDPLSSADSARLLQNLLLSLPGPGGQQPVEGLPAALKEQILSRGEGNPFYVQEILRALIRSGAIVCDEATCRWQEGSEVENTGIPETLYGVLRARIDQLPAGARHTLQLAAVIGRIFTHRLLADMAQRSELDEHLVALQREDLIRERARLPEAEYIFEHQLTLEAAYGGLLKRVRRVLHRRVAEALERLYPERIEEQLGLLAHHWEQAGEMEQSVVYLRRAGEQAAAQYANEEAVGYLSRALARMPEDDLAARFALLSLREAVYDLQGAREDQQDDLSQLQEIAAVLDDGGPEAARRLAEVALREANYYGRTFNQAARTAAAQRAVRLAQAAGDAGLEAEGHLRWGSALADSWDGEGARSHWEKALAFSRAAGRRPLEAQVLRELGITVNEIGRFGEARHYLEQNWRIHQESGNRMEEGKALNALAMNALELHHVAQAHAYIKDGLSLCRRTGNRLDEAWALLHQGEILSALGQHAAGIELLQEALHLFHRVDDPVGKIRVIQSRGWIVHRVGDDAASREYSERALRTADEIDAQPIRVTASIALGDALASQARWAKARTAYQQVLALCRDKGWDHWAVSAQAGLARIALAREDLKEAQAHVLEIVRVLEAYPTLDGTYDPMRIYWTCYQVLRAASDPRAQEVLNTARGLLQEWADQIDDEGLRRSFLENVAAHREIVAETTRGQTA